MDPRTFFSQPSFPSESLSLPAFFGSWGHASPFPHRWLLIRSPFRVSSASPNSAQLCSQVSQQWTLSKLFDVSQGASHRARSPKWGAIWGSKTRPPSEQGVAAHYPEDKSGTSKKKKQSTQPNYPVSSPTQGTTRFPFIWKGPTPHHCIHTRKNDVPDSAHAPSLGRYSYRRYVYIAMISCRRHALAELRRSWPTKTFAPASSHSCWQPLALGITMKLLF